MKRAAEMSSSWENCGKTGGSDRRTFAFRPRLPMRFQFGISTLLWTMTGTAAVLALTVSMPAVVAVPIMLFIGGVALPRFGPR